MPATFWLNIAIAAALTAAIYGAGPILYVMCRKKQSTVRDLRIFCAVYTLIVWGIVQAVSYDGGRVRTGPAILWSGVFYLVAKSILIRKKAPDVPKPESKKERWYTCPKCGKLVRKGETCACELVQPQAERKEDVSDGLTFVCAEEAPQDEAQQKKRQTAKFNYILSVLLVFCICILGYYAFDITEERDSLAAGNETLEIKLNDLSEENDSLKARVLQLRGENAALTARVADLADYLPDVMFLYDNIGFVVSGSNRYHNYECPIFRNADEYWAHNIEYCEYMGYSPCRDCW